MNLKEEWRKLNLMLRRFLTTLTGFCFHYDVSLPYNKKQTCLTCGKQIDFNQKEYRKKGKWYYDSRN
jgi:hypothetical protein